MQGKKKIWLLVIAGLVISAAVIAVIIYNSMQTKTFAKGDGSQTTRPGKDGNPTVITIEKDPEVDRTRDIRNRITSLVTAKVEGYDNQPFGGLSGIKLKLRNSTDYVIDSAELNVIYYKAGGDIFKTETVYVDALKPRGSIVVSAPDSPRGTSVKVVIEAITSKSLGLCFVKGSPGPDADDPYICN